MPPALNTACRARMTEAILADIVRSLGRDRDAVRKAVAILCEIAVGDFAGLDDAAWPL